MKRILFILIVVALLATACAPAQGEPGAGEGTNTPAAAPTQGAPTAEPTREPTEQPTAQPAEAPSAADAPVEAAQAALAETLGIETAAIEVVSSRPVEWPDSCLGVTLPGVMCAQVITPGYIIILEANGKQYEYHTNADGSAIQAGEVELSWHREGGIAGFCDDLVVLTTGEFHAAQCAGEGRAGNGNLRETLSAEQLAQYEVWLEKFGTVTIEMDDGAVADSMKVSLFLKGRGTAQPNEAEQQALLAWAQTLYSGMNQR